MIQKPTEKGLVPPTDTPTVPNRCQSGNYPTAARDRHLQDVTNGSRANGASGP